MFAMEDHTWTKVVVACVKMGPGADFESFLDVSRLVRVLMDKCHAFAVQAVPDMSSFLVKL